MTSILGMPSGPLPSFGLGPFGVTADNLLSKVDTRFLAVPKYVLPNAEGIEHPRDNTLKTLANDGGNKLCDAISGRGLGFSI